MGRLKDQYEKEQAEKEETVQWREKRTATIISVIIICIIWGISLGLMYFMLLPVPSVDSVDSIEMMIDDIDTSLELSMALPLVEEYIPSATDDCMADIEIPDEDQLDCRIFYEFTICYDWEAEIRYSFRDYFLCKNIDQTECIDKRNHEFICARPFGLDEWIAFINEYWPDRVEIYVESPELITSSRSGKEYDNGCIEIDGYRICHGQHINDTVWITPFPLFHDYDKEFISGNKSTVKVWPKSEIGDISGGNTSIDYGTIIDMTAGTIGYCLCNDEDFTGEWWDECDDWSCYNWDGTTYGIEEELLEANVSILDESESLIIWDEANGTLAVWEYNCTDGIDNDGDGKIDCFDFDCADKTKKCIELWDAFDSSIGAGMDEDDNIFVFLFNDTFRFYPHNDTLMAMRKVNLKGFEK